jgi:hypothetical protein
VRTARRALSAARCPHSNRSLPPSRTSQWIGSPLQSGAVPLLVAQKNGRAVPQGTRRLSLRSLRSDHRQPPTVRAIPAAHVQQVVRSADHPRLRRTAPFAVRDDEPVGTSVRLVVRVTTCWHHERVAAMRLGENPILTHSLDYRQTQQACEHAASQPCDCQWAMRGNSDLWPEFWRDSSGPGGGCRLRVGPGEVPDNHPDRSRSVPLRLLRHRVVFRRNVSAPILWELR